jgi:hypothetical protein
LNSGFEATDSVVTLMHDIAISAQGVVSDASTTDAYKLVEVLAKSLVTCYASHVPYINDCLLVVSPEQSDTLKSG